MKLKLSSILLLIIILISCKNESIITDNPTKPTFQKENFPQDWIGNYKGELNIFSVDSISMNLEMGLKIQPLKDSLYSWELTYNMKGKEKDVRKYELKVVDAQKGHYIIDEKNTILIDAFYRNKIFTSFFEVMNSYIVATYTKENNQLIFEIISASGKKTTKTGNAKHNGEDIPEVITYFVNGRQKAILYQVDE